MFERKVFIIEKVPAWVICPNCEGDPMEYVDGQPCLCPDCHGIGGSWLSLDAGKGTLCDVRELFEVTKSTFLVREWEPCIQCGSEDGTIRKAGTVNERLICDRCKGTGAEPNTAGPWRVE